MSLTNPIPVIKREDWNSVVEFSKRVRQNFQQLAHLRLGYDSTPTFESLTLEGLTASRLVQTDSEVALVSVSDLTSWVAGVANEIDITDDGDGTVTIGIVNPLIVGKGGTGTGYLTDHSILVGSASSAITALTAATNGQFPIGSTGADPVIAALTGTSNQITVTNAAGSITLSLPQDIHTSAEPTFYSGDFTNHLHVGSTVISGGVITAVGSLSIRTDGDASDYLIINTVSDVPTIGTLGSCDLHITSSSGLKLTATSGEIDFDNENLTTTGNIKCNLLTLTGPTQDWLFTGSWASLALQGQTSEADVRLQLFSKDGLETDFIMYEVYTDGSPGSLANTQWMRSGWNADFDIFQIQVGKSGSGEDRDLKIQATGKIELEAAGVLKLDGSSVASDTIFADDTSSTASPLVFGSSGHNIRRSTSSGRFKTIDSDMTAEKAACVLDIIPKKFYSKCEHDDPDKPFYGLIAEDVAEQFPEAAVLGENDQIESYDINFLVAALIKQIQVQDEKIKMLEDSQGGVSSQ